MHQVFVSKPRSRRTPSALAFSRATTSYHHHGLTTLPASLLRTTQPACKDFRLPVDPPSAPLLLLLPILGDGKRKIIQIKWLSSIYLVLLLLSVVTCKKNDTHDTENSLHVSRHLSCMCSSHTHCYHRNPPTHPPPPSHISSISISYILVQPSQVSLCLSRPIGTAAPTYGR